MYYNLNNTIPQNLLYDFTEYLVKLYEGTDGGDFDGCFPAVIMFRGFKFELDEETTTWYRVKEDK